MNWKKILAVAFFAPAILFLIALLAALLLEEKIKQQVITEVNKELTAPVKVGGKITLSFLRHFPDASLQFEAVSIANKLKPAQDDLASVRELSFLFSLPDLLQGNINIRKIFLQSGSVFVLKDKDGKTNLDILKPQSETDNGVGLQLSNIVLQNVNFRYLDEGNNFNLKARVRKMDLKGEFGKPAYSLSATGNFFLETVQQGEESYAANKQIGIDALLNITLSGKQIAIAKGNVDIEKNPFTVSGSIGIEKRKTLLDLQARSEGNDISNFVALMPLSVRNRLKDFEGKGAYNIQANVQGEVSKLQSPQVKIVAGLEDGNIKLSKYGRELNHVFVNVEYGLNETGEDYLRISDFRSRVSEQPFQFSLLLKKLAQPDFVFNANGTLHLTEVAPFIPDTVMTDLKGSVRFTAFSLHGNVEDLKNLSRVTLNGGGIFQLNDVAFKAQQIAYHNINGIITYSGKKLEAKNLSIAFLNTDAVFNGSISNLVQYIAALVERKPMNDIVLDAEGKLEVKTLQLAEMIETFSKQQKQSGGSKPKVDVRDVFRINGNLVVNIRKFSYKKMVFDDVNVNVTLSPLHLRLNNFSTTTMGGSVKGNGYFVFTGTNDLLMNIGTEIADIDVGEVLRQTENFGQQTLTDKHLQGTLNAKFYMKNVWKEYTEPDLNNLNAIIDFELKNGALKNFEPVKAASAFIRVEELMNIKFSDIRNRLTIFNRTVSIPAFEIQSNALNLMFSGQHDFDNMIDYRFKINLRKMLANKFNRKGREQFIEDDPYEGLNIYLSMKGPLANPKIQYDKATAAAKIKEDFKNEKEVLKNLFRKNNEQDKSDKREEKFYQIEEQPKFMEFEQ